MGDAGFGPDIRSQPGQLQEPGEQIVAEGMPATSIAVISDSKGRGIELTKGPKSPVAEVRQGWTALSQFRAPAVPDLRSRRTRSATCCPRSSRMQLS